MLILDVWRKIYAWYGKRKTYKKYGLRTKHYFVGKRYDIGEYTYGIPTVHVYDDTAKLKIGKFCSLAGGVEIVLGGNHHIDWCSTFSFMKQRNTSRNGRSLICHKVVVREMLLLGMMFGLDVMHYCSVAHKSEMELS